jgi:hypothetical protein
MIISRIPRLHHRRQQTAVHNAVVDEHPPERPGDIFGDAQRVRVAVLLDVDAQIQLVAKVARVGERGDEAREGLGPVFGDDADVDAGTVPACI